MPVNFFHEAWSYVGVAAFVVLLRFALKLYHGGWRHLAVDDALMFCAILCYSAETTAAHMIVSWMGLANNNMTPQQRASLDPHSEEWSTRVKGSKMNIVGWFTYLTLFWLLKSCWTIFYSRMTNGVHNMDVRIKLAWGMLGTTYLACVCVIVFQCRPFNKNWQINPNPGNQCQPAYSFLQVSFLMALNTVTDLYLMVIPIPIIWKARLDKRTKIQLLVLFSLSWIVIIFGIIRCVTLVTTGEYEMSQSGPWSVRESFLGVLVSNAPVVVPLFKRWLQNMTGMATSNFRSGKGDSYQLDSQNKDSNKSDSHGMSSLKDGKKKNKFRHPLSLPTKWGSDEDMVTMDQQMMGTGGRGVESKDGKDNASETTVGDKRTSLEMDGVPVQPANLTRISEQSHAEKSNGYPRDIRVTRKWEVAREQ